MSEPPEGAMKTVDELKALYLKVNPKNQITVYLTTPAELKIRGVESSHPGLLILRPTRNDPEYPNGWVQDNGRSDCYFRFNLETQRTFWSKPNQLIFPFAVLQYAYNPYRGHIFLNYWHAYAYALRSNK